MQKLAPTPARLFTMVAFTLSCFGLLLFLWKAFGGPVPLAPQGYQVRVAFPEAGQLATEADVRIAGVRVGKVRAKEVDERAGRTVATLEIESRYAPIASNTKAMLRSKTIIGETYVELTPGDKRRGTLAEDARLPDGQVTEAVQLDEVLDTLDGPVREAFSDWQQAFGQAVGRRGRDINAAVAQMPQVVGEGTELLRVLEREEAAVRGIVDATGATFESVAQDAGALRGLVRSARATFGATARRREDLATTIRILPTFLEESRLTLNRTERFARRADPVVRDLGPALQALRPAMTALQGVSPDLRRAAQRLGPTIDAASDGLPALADVSNGIRPMLDALVPVLADLNPVLEWLEYNQRLTLGFFNASAGLQMRTQVGTSATNGRLLRAQSPAGLESLALWASRLPGHRGNAYLSPSAYTDRRRAQKMVLPSWDCKNSGRGEFTTQKGDTNDDPSCWVQGWPGWKGKLTHGFPRIERADYSK